jgi:glucoamylase
MPRDIPVGNGDLLITFDALPRPGHLLPHVGRYNHTDGHVQRFGVWADGRLAWIEDPSLATGAPLQGRQPRHRGPPGQRRLGLEIICHDAVDFHEPVYFRRVTVRDLFGTVPRCPPLLPLGPVHPRHARRRHRQLRPLHLLRRRLQGRLYFLFNACDEHKCGIDHWAIGTKRVGGAEGTWRDAEDGQLGRNAISQGSVDATIGFNLQVPATGRGYVTSWLACGHSYPRSRPSTNASGNPGPTGSSPGPRPTGTLGRKEPARHHPAARAGVRDLFYRSQLVLRTQIDNGGAIIAANDSDITQFGGDHYSYCWMRDGALVAYASSCGQSELSRSFFRYCATASIPTGRTSCTSTPPRATLPRRGTPGCSTASDPAHPAGRDGPGPLGAAQALRDLPRRGVRQAPLQPAGRPPRRVDAPLPRPQRPAAPRAGTCGRNAGASTPSRSATIGALHAAAAFARDFGEQDRAAAYREGAEPCGPPAPAHVAPRAAALRPHRRAPGRRHLPPRHDRATPPTTPSSPSPAFDPNDPRMASEMKAPPRPSVVKTADRRLRPLRARLLPPGRTRPHHEVPGNPWVICTLWQAQYRHRQGAPSSHARGRRCSRATRVGVGRAAELQPHTGSMSGASPRAPRIPKSGVLAEQFHPVHRRRRHRTPVSPLTDGATLTFVPMPVPSA